jgi:hypothetical protein
MNGLRDQASQTESWAKQLPRIDAEQLTGLRRIRYSRAAIHVDFSDMDITIRVSPPQVGTVKWETEWNVAAREPGPGLGTWWGRWRRSVVGDQADFGSHIVDEIRGTLEHVRRLVGVHTHGDRVSAIAGHSAADG